MTYGQPTTLPLELSLWQAEYGSPDKRYTKVVCHYRVQGNASYTAAPMKAVRVEPKSLFVECQLPAISQGQGTAVEYYFDFYFDGVYNQAGTPTKPYVVPLVAQSTEIDK
jgi:hypothetical protein